MDSAYIADPDNVLLMERAAVCLEHQSVPLTPDKSKKLGDYDTQLVVDEHLPTLVVIASHWGDKYSQKELIRTPSDITKFHFLDLGERKICEMLNYISGIMDIRKELSNEEALTLGAIALYVPRNRLREITKKIVNLYTEIVGFLDSDMEFLLFWVINIMIDAFFDDEDEYERLINMIENVTSSETIDRFEFVSELEQRNEELDQRNVELDQRNEELEGNLEDANKEIENLRDENSRIPILENEIKKLKEQLNRK